MVKRFKEFNKSRVSEQQEPNEIERLFGTGKNSKTELIKKIVSLIEMISKSNPTDQGSYDDIKNRIKDARNEIVNHPDFKEFKKEGFDWQGTKIRLDEWEADLKKSVKSLYSKALKKGLI